MKSATMAFLWQLLVTFLMFGCALARLPTMKCKYPSNGFVTCAQKEIVSFVPEIIAHGVSEKNIKSLDPLTIPTISTTITAGPIKSDTELHKNVVRGMKNLKFKDISVIKFEPPKTVEFILKTLNPTLEVEGLYKEKILAIVDEGTYALKLTNVESIVKISSHFEKKFGGRLHLKVDRITVQPTIGDMKITLASKKRAMLGTPASTLANKFWPVLYKEAWPYIEPQVEKIIKDIINDIASKISLDEIFTG